jgi:hypothetical protein
MSASTSEVAKRAWEVEKAELTKARDEAISNAKVSIFSKESY